MHQPLRGRPVAPSRFLIESLQPVPRRDLRRRYTVLDLYSREHILGLLQQRPMRKPRGVSRGTAGANRHGPARPARVLRRPEFPHDERDFIRQSVRDAENDRRLFFGGCLGRRDRRRCWRRRRTACDYRGTHLLPLSPTAAEAESAWRCRSGRARGHSGHATAQRCLCACIAASRWIVTYVKLRSIDVKRY
jgi:hypothetical protein